jgi:histidine phosphotransferase ChpT
MNLRGSAASSYGSSKGRNMTEFALGSLDLAALLCSRVCHDVISPVGAIVNGLEMLDEEKDPEMRGFALDLIKKSAHTASARLQFCRLAFGAAGSAGAAIDTGDAEKVTRGLLEDERTKLTWNVPRVLMAKDKVKLILNLCLIAAATIPRGGLITVNVDTSEPTPRIDVEASGTNVRLASHVPQLLSGTPENNQVDAHGIQAFYTGLIARASDLTLTVAATSEKIRLAACPAATAALAQAPA